MYRTVAEKLASDVVRDGECLRWTGGHMSSGYGKIYLGLGKYAAAHRTAYEHAHGPIPEGLEIDHVAARGCRFRDCIEPGHLEAVTHLENLRRKTALITACPKGHPYTEANTRRTGKAKNRSCRSCFNAKRRSLRANNA